MVLTEKIQYHVQKLPPSFQAEVLDFVEYLTAKADREAGRHEEEDWASLSLALAMRGMEEEETPTYTTSDLRVVFS